MAGQADELSKFMYLYIYFLKKGWQYNNYIFNFAVKNIFLVFLIFVFVYLQSLRIFEMSSSVFDFIIKAFNQIFKCSWKEYFLDWDLQKLMNSCKMFCANFYHQFYSNCHHNKKVYEKR